MTITLFDIERHALAMERTGRWQLANWIRSQAQEILVVLNRGDMWPEVFGR